MIYSYRSLNESLSLCTKLAINADEWPTCEGGWVNERGVVVGGGSQSVTLQGR